MDVIVGDDGNYKVILKDTINGTVEVPDNWETVRVDLNGNDIKGADATEETPAGAGLVMKTDENGTKPGTNLDITDSTGTGVIKGGDGSAEYPDGAPGIETETEEKTPASS